MAVILENLRIMRKAKGVKQSVLADALGCDSTNYSRKERGQIPITTEEWVKISTILNEPIASFFTQGHTLVSKTPEAYSPEERNYISRLIGILRGGNRIAISGIKNIIDSIFQSLRPNPLMQTIQKGFKSKKGENQNKKAEKGAAKKIPITNHNNP